MIVEQLIDDGKRVRHYSDSSVKIRQKETGAVYDDAVDVMPCRYTYTETDEPIDDMPTIENKAEAYDILMGVES